MQNIVTRVKAAGLTITGVTIIPRQAATWTPQMTDYRNQVNAWIRTGAGFHKVFDFDKVIRDASNPILMNPILDFGDHVHPIRSAT
jgi:hypothetical protein